MQSLHPKPPKHHSKRPVFIRPGLWKQHETKQPYDGPKVLQRKDKVLTSMCNNRIAMTQRIHLDDFLPGRIIGPLECGCFQIEVFEELGIESRVSSLGFGNDFKIMIINRRSIASKLPCQHSSAPGMAVSRQIVYRRLGQIGLYARRPVRCVPLNTTHCHLFLAGVENMHCGHHNSGLV
ncbi:HTH_Tnp_Tc3_2 domain-containing protein [Trichonephila clavipes]|nr:HTH_Tnp_Tc3_2 domain-containing protein [Trichonephila clavipes]